MPDELKRLEYEMLDELKACETSLEAANVIEGVLVRLGMPKLASKYMTFIQKRSSMHHK